MAGHKMYQIPEFGYWAFNDDVPISQYFRYAKREDFHRDRKNDREFYHENLRMTTTDTRAKGRTKRRSEQRAKEVEQQGRICDVNGSKIQPRTPKAVDDDLYKIPPEFLNETHRAVTPFSLSRKHVRTQMKTRLCCMCRCFMADS